MTNDIKTCIFQSNEKDNIDELKKKFESFNVNKKIDLQLLKDSLTADEQAGNRLAMNPDGKFLTTVKFIKPDQLKDFSELIIADTGDAK